LATQAGWRALEPAAFPWLDYRRYAFSLGLEAAGTAILSGQTAAEYDPESRRIVARGGLVQQANTIYDKIEAILASGGLTLNDAIHVVENVSAASIDDYPMLAGARTARIGGANPTVSTICVDRLLRPEALVEIQVVASHHAQTLGGLVYLPAILPLDEAGNVVDGDLDSQAEAAFDNARRLLAVRGLGPSHIAWITRFVRAGAGPVQPYDILMVRMSHPKALVQLEVLASEDPVTTVVAGAARAARTGQVLLISGVAPGHRGIVDQTREAYQGILAALGCEGAGPSALIETVEYVSHQALPGYRETAAVREELLRRPYPASTGLVCVGLGRPGSAIQVTALAVLSRS
jgi:enamine deaminase RidA (YjgF/YER057c/UK114 family)